MQFLLRVPKLYPRSSTDRMKSYELFDAGSTPAEDAKIYLCGANGQHTTFLKLTSGFDSSQGYQDLGLW